MSDCPKAPMRIFGPLDHYNYPELDKTCSCPICVECRERLEALQQAQKLIQDKYPCRRPGCHIDMKGTCPECKTGTKLRTSLLASMNRRDFYSECSFHAAHETSPTLGEAFMAWVTNVLNNRTERPDGWWIAKGPFLPIAYWQIMFRRSVTLGEDDLVEEFDSDLLPRNGALSALTVSTPSGVY